MMMEVITRGVELLSALLPREWNEKNVLRLEDVVITITYSGGKASLAQGDCPEAESIIQLSNQRFCSIIDGSIDFMTVWRELAEPSPTDRTYILKGTGAKLFALLDGLIKCYQSEKEFKKLLDEYKSCLEK